MYGLPLYLVPIDPRWQQPLPQPPLFMNPFFIQHHQAAPFTTMMPWNGSYGGPISTGPVHQGMAQQRQSQHYQHRAPSSGPHRNERERFLQERHQRMVPTQQHRNHQYQDPIPGPSRNQRQRFRQAEPRYPNHIIYESFGTVAGDRSTGFNPGMARIKANKNTGDGKVRRTPSKN